MEADNRVKINFFFFFPKTKNMAKIRKRQSVGKVGDYFKETIGVRNKSKDS